MKQPPKTLVVRNLPGSHKDLRRMYTTHQLDAARQAGALVGERWSGEENMHRTMLREVRIPTGGRAWPGGPEAYCVALFRWCPSEERWERIPATARSLSRYGTVGESDWTPTAG